MLDRLEKAEQRRAADRKWIITTIITALGVGGGGSVSAYLSGGTSDATIQNGVAVEMAAAEQFREDVSADIDHLHDEQAKLTNAISKMQGALEILSQQDRRALEQVTEVSGLIEAIDEVHEKHPGDRAKGPDPARIQRLKRRMFGD